MTRPTDPARGDLRASWAAWAAIVLLTLPHVWLAFRFPLAPDETYYWEWSRNLQWGYFDQGPGIAAIIGASTAVLGHTPIGVRAGIIVLAFVLRIVIYVLTRRLFGPRAGLIAVLISSITPLSLAGGFTATYDLPLALCWALSMLLLAQATTTRSRWCWPALGAVVGLGMLSKLTMALAFPCALLYLAGRPELRHWLRRPDPYAATLIALLVLAPNLLWQSRNEWVTFGHLVTISGKGVDRGPLRTFGDFVASQAGVLTPLLFLGLLGALVATWSARRRTGGQGMWLAWCFGAPVLLLFAMAALKGRVQANWAICGWVGASVAYAGWLADGPTRRRRGFAWLAGGSAALLSVLVASPELRVAVGLRVPASWDQSRKTYGGKELAAACEHELNRLRAEGRVPVVGSATYDTASRLAFYLHGRPRTHCFFLGTRANSYLYFNRRSGLRPGGDALVVDNRPPDDPLLPRFDLVFDRVEHVPEPVLITVPGLYDGPINEYHLYRCHGYRPNPAVELPGRG